MHNFSTNEWMHYNPVRIAFGIGSFRKLHELLPSKGKILLVTTKGFTRRGLTQKVIDQFENDRIIILDNITANPELDDLDQATLALKNMPVVGIIALGGGSVMDAAKVLSVTLPTEVHSPLKHFLRDGNSHVWEQNIPVTAVPTTSGTGAEVTPFATVWDQTTKKKHSVTGEKIFPKHALIDPELTLDLPPDQTLYTSLDTISHALESLWNKNRSTISEAFAFEALKLANKSLQEILSNPRNLEARSEMQQASTLAGLAISRTRTAIAHSISYPLTSYFGVPHGLACSFTLPVILRTHLKDLARNSSEEELLKKVLSLLESLKLEEKIKQYATALEIKALKTQMFTKERADNFIFEVDDIEIFLPN